MNVELALGLAVALGIGLLVGAERERRKGSGPVAGPPAFHLRTRRPSVLAALTTNSITKAVVAATAGGRRYALQIIPGLLLVLAAIWAGSFLAG